MIPGHDVHGGCNSCAEAVEGAEEPAEAVDCRIFHYPSADWTNRGRCWRDEVACWWTWLRRRSGCYQPLTSPLDSSWFGWASIRVPFFISISNRIVNTHTQMIIIVIKRETQHNIPLDWGVLLGYGCNPVTLNQTRSINVLMTKINNTIYTCLSKNSCNGEKKPPHTPK
jgi:hypothetical protein